MTHIVPERAELDVIEASEALAAQACAFAHEARFDAARLNPNGAGISIGRRARWRLPRRCANRNALVVALRLSVTDMRRLWSDHCGCVRKRAIAGHCLNPGNNPENRQHNEAYYYPRHAQRNHDGYLVFLRCDRAEQQFVFLLYCRRREGIGRALGLGAQT
jgi:acetyl-CoA C-acetyltransferase